MEPSLLPKASCLLWNNANHAIYILYLYMSLSIISTSIFPWKPTIFYFLLSAILLMHVIALNCSLKPFIWQSDVIPWGWVANTCLYFCHVSVYITGQQSHTGWLRHGTTYTHNSLLNSSGLHGKGHSCDQPYYAWGLQAQ